MTKPAYDPTSWPWVRQCQECDHKQIAKHPAEYKSDTWMDVKCKACGSEALDYGSRRPWTEQQKADYAAWEEWENSHSD